MVRDVVALLDSIAAARDVRIETDATRAGGSVRLPEDSLRQVLYSVIVNGVEASPPGGVVTIEAAVADGAADIVVSDQGKGIAPELRQQIYEPFFTTKDNRATGGLGLGLSIARGIVEALQGTLSFRSEPGRGTAFHICLPAIAKETESHHV